MRIPSRWLFVALAAAALGACAGRPPPPPPPPPAPTVLRAELVADAALNPDVRGRPSPLIVRVLELKSRTAFDGTDFFALFNREKDALGTDLVAVEELVLQPGSAANLDRTLGPDTRFVGVLAAYRNLERARWRTAVAIPPHRTTRLTITAGALGIAVADEE